jgi:hypothetical protein
VSFDGATFTGTVNNEQEKVKSVKIGQKVNLRFRCRDYETPTVAIKVYDRIVKK